MRAGDRGLRARGQIIRPGARGWINLTADKYMFAAVFEKHPFTKFSKIKLSSEAAIRMNFSVSLFSTYSEIP